MTDNLELWNKVNTTNPEYTKSFNRGGGFKGTAINPIYQIRRATELFGPVGIGWGWEVLNEEIIKGAPLFSEKLVVGNELIHSLLVKVWYVYEEKRGEVVQYGATTLVGQNKYGFFTDEETKKKSLTDAIGKALSCLGFSADIHLGLYDDNKYINDLKQQIAEKNYADKESEIESKLKTLTTEGEIRDYFKSAMELLGINKSNRAVYDIWTARFSAAVKSLAKE